MPALNRIPYFTPINFDCCTYLFAAPASLNIGMEEVLL
ncbi:hypothetical protein C4K15_3681 [Pseudomonas chlororaphis subsp. aurantiaca]|nr:hypothetical protein C4K15_3681 [Pseudomonas chlororaphis subsp. aurantiaca]